MQKGSSYSPSSGWVSVRLGDVAKWGSGGTPSRKKQEFFKGSIPWVKTGELKGKYITTTDEHITPEAIDQSSAKIFPIGSVAIAMYGATIGNVSILGIDAATNQACAVADVSGGAIDNLFLYYYVGYISPKLVDAGIGGAQPNISQGLLKSWPINLPPLSEQRRIVAKIEELFSELDKGVESLKTARAQLKTYRQSLLKAAFEGRLTEQWRRDNADQLETADQLLERIRKEREARYQRQLEEWKVAVAEWEADGKPGKKPRKPSVEKPLPEFEAEELEVLPRLPKAWRYVRLATIASVGSGMSVSKSRKLVDPVEVAYLRVANVQRGRLVLDEIKTMLIEQASLKDLQLKKWDVLFNEGGDRDKLGRGWVWEDQVDPCITQNHVFRATTYLGDEFHAKFISYWGNVFGQDYFERVGKQTTNLASINKSVLKMFPVPVPPHDEQREVINRIEEIESQVTMLEKQIEDGLSRSEALRQSILKRAFEGKLVPQDPNDEPASVLLERIRQEQANAPKPGRRERQAEASA